MYKEREDYLYQEESKKIVDACRKVWNQFGGAFKESIVDKALTLALKDNGLSIEDQKRIEVYFNGKKVGTYVIDKVVNNAIIIEMKCKKFVTVEDKKQFWYYLKASQYKVGYLINFGPKQTEIVRRIYDTARTKSV